MKNQPHLVILLIILSIISTLFIPAITSGSGTPHAIIGYVNDNGLIGIMGATVYFNSSLTLDSLSQTTDYLGRFSVDIDAFPNGYMPGDILLITAVYHLYKSTDTLTVDTNPIQLIQINLDCLVHIIDGYVTKKDGSPASQYPVKVANEDRNESKLTTTLNNGYYSMDLSIYTNGYSLNDDTIVSVIFNGFSGSNYSVVSASHNDMINITLDDVQKPVLTFQEAPLNVNLNQSFRILLWVTDNFGIDSVKLLLKEPGHSLFTEINMVQDDGAFNDWDNNKMPTLPLYGQSTNRTISNQTDIGIAVYYFEVSDSTFTVTLPSINPQLNSFQIVVMDPTPPSLSHTPITQMESGQIKEITSIANDNIGVSQVNLFYRKSTSSAFNKTQMLFNGDPNEFNATIPPQQYQGILQYFITCNDTSNNTVRLPAIGYYLVNVIDTTAPFVSHSKINSANVGDPINFTCLVSEGWLANVWINYTDVHGFHYNHTMQHTGTAWSYLNASGQDANGTFHYTLWANDTSGNLASLSHTMPIYDAGTPLITHVPPEYLDYNKPKLLSAFVVDNVSIAGAALFYKSVNAPAFNQTSMISIDADVKMKNFTAQIPPQTQLGFVEYYINASDGTNNISWPALAPFYQVEVRDTEPPIISTISFMQYANAQNSSYVSVVVSDNHLVGNVTLNYLNSTNPAWQSIAMSFIGSNHYSTQIPAQGPGIVRFFIFASDASGNNATLPAYLPKLNPYLMEFVISPIPLVPNLNIKASIAIGVNRSCNIYTIVTNNPENAEVELFYKGTQSTVYILSQMTLFQNGTFVASFPAQNRSGLIQYFVRSREGVNIFNQTSVLKINVTNQLPIIYHIGVESAPVGEKMAIVALVTDDLHVENVTLAWRPKGTVPYTNAAMLRDGSSLYAINLSQSQPVVIQYHIVARDAEGQSQFPLLLDLELTVKDLEAPVISHEPIHNLTTGEMPIIIASVTDNRQISSVQVWFKNSTAESFSTAPMSQVSGTDDYAALLGYQSEGNFTYYIEANDGINTARSPSNGTYSVDVDFVKDSNPFSSILLVIVIILIAVALVLVIIHLRRKSIK